MTSRRAAAAIVLVLCLGAPVLELGDHWDPVDQQGGDTELAVVVAALCVGVALTVATIAILHGRRPSALFESRNLPRGVPAFAAASHGVKPDLRGRAPTSLRI